MGINIRIHNVKNIDDFEFIIPTIKGLYALTGENGSGKSTIISCAAAAFFYPKSPDDYFGSVREGAFIQFKFNDKTREIKEKNQKWDVPRYREFLGITGFYEGSIVFGNRFKEIEYSYLNKLNSITKEQVHDASSFVKENLGSILHDNKNYYHSLYVLNKNVADEKGLKRSTYFFENKGALINQLKMSTGENLLLTILNLIEQRLNKKIYGDIPAFMFLDEIELALHSSALRRLVFFLNDIAENKNTVVLFSTHSIELIRSISPNNIFYLQRHLNGELETINPCYPVYATRNLESSNYGHDYIILVEDLLAQKIVERILKEQKLLSNKRILVIAAGGWSQVLRFAYDMIRSNLTLCTTKILIILDKDIKKSVSGYMEKEKIGFSTPINFLPIESLEKYLLEKLVTTLDINLFRNLNDYLFQGKSLDEIIKDYNYDIKNGKYKGQTKISNGKKLYSLLIQELEKIRQTENELVSIVIEYLFDKGNFNELITFLKKELTPASK